MGNTSDTEHIMRYPPFKVGIGQGAYERRFRLSCNVCYCPFGYRIVTEDSSIAKFSKSKVNKYAPFDRLTFVNPKKIKIINLKTDKVKLYSFKKSTTDRGKTATTTVSTIEKDDVEVEQFDTAYSYHMNVAIKK